MASRAPVTELHDIQSVILANPAGASRAVIADSLSFKISPRTLQLRLSQLVADGLIIMDGRSKAIRYRPSPALSSLKNLSPHQALVAEDPLEYVPLNLCKQSMEIQRLVRAPLSARKIVGYDRKFLDSYRPNETSYFTSGELETLHKLSKVPIVSQPAGTFARNMLGRLLIDLSWSSSRLEGNSYSKLDTKQLIDFGKVAEGKDRIETQMILNHKDAIEFLVNTADEISFNRYTLLNLHALLANSLLSNAQSEGRLRRIEVFIGQSTFQPLAVPQLIEEYFNQILATASAIKDPFEQSLFIMVQLPYLQPFDDVNKRVSRLAANISLIKANLIPLTFLDVSESLYIEAVLGVYELNRVDLLKDLYLWAYKRSAERYAVVQQSIGPPDPFRLKHKESLTFVIRAIVIDALNRGQALNLIESWSRENIAVDERAQFIEMSEDELLALHEGNFARYKIRPSEFERWQKVWN